MSLKIGVCLGSNADPAAICVVEVEEREIVENPPLSAVEIMRLLLAGQKQQQDDEQQEEEDFNRRECGNLGLRGPGLRRRRNPPIPPEPEEAETRLHLNVRFLERFPPGTPMVEVAVRLREIVGNARDRNRDGLTIFLDVTGKGEPVLDMFREKVPDCYIVPVFFNFGDQVLNSHGVYTLGKAALVAKLKVLFELKRLHLSRGPDSELLTKELMDYEVHLEPDANTRSGAFKVGSRDELVTALGLAVFERNLLIRIR
jgi:hypothetical protein